MVETPPYDRVCSVCARVDRVHPAPGEPKECQCIHCLAHFCREHFRRHLQEAAETWKPFDGKEILTCTVCGRASFAHHCPVGCPGGEFTGLSTPPAVYVNA